jgi:hypothetical protein
VCTARVAMCWVEYSRFLAWKWRRTRPHEKAKPRRSDPEVYSGEKTEEGPNHGACPAFPLSSFRRL